MNRRNNELTHLTYKEGLDLYNSFTPELLKNLEWPSGDKFNYLLDLSDDCKSYIGRVFIGGDNNYLSINGGTLPEVTVTASPKNKNPKRYIELHTYYPGGGEFPLTGHSELYRLNGNPRTDYFYTGEGRNNGNGALFISKSGKNPTYNLITNNCSDATRRALEIVSKKNLNTFLFTTPGDVQDFAKKLGAIDLTKKRIIPGYRYTNDKIIPSKYNNTNTFESVYAIPIDLNTLNSLKMNKTYIYSGKKLIKKNLIGD